MALHQQGMGLPVNRKWMVWSGTMVGEINNFVLWAGRPEPWKLEAFPTRENPLGRSSFVVEAELFRQTPIFGVGAADDTFLSIAMYALL
jgi:hypothetical protein